MSLNSILATTPLTSTNFILKATGTTIGNSLIFDNGTNVGIGNTNTSYTLDVTGTGRFTGNLNAAAFLGNLYTNTWYAGSGSTLSLRTAASGVIADFSPTNSNILGFVGINGSTASGAALSVYDQTSGSEQLRLCNSTGSGYWGIGRENNITGNLYFNSGGSLKVVFAASGNVGIGTSSPLGRFDVYRAAGLSGTAAIVISSGESSPARNWSLNTEVVDAGDFAICVSTTTGGTPSPTGANAKLRILSDGTLLIGGASSAGAYNLSLGNATANTYYQVRSTNTNSLYGADTRGTWMGNLSSKEAYINCPSFVPGVDNATSCGTSSYRWSVVYAVNGSIQTSDVRQKTDIFTSDLGLDFINKLNPVSYKWKVGGNDVEYSSVEDEDGKITPSSVATPKIGVRNHYGLIAQQVKEVLGDKDFGGFVHDKETDMMSLRYDQFISPLVKAIQELSKQNEELSNRLIKLESK